MGVKIDYSILIVITKPPPLEVVFYCLYSVSYTHLTLPTNREV